MATASNAGLELREHVAAGAGRLRCAHGEFLQAAAGRQQADAGFDQPDVAFEVRNRARRMHLEFAAAAQRQAAHRGDHRHQRILDALAGRLEVGDHRVRSRRRRRPAAGRARRPGPRRRRTALSVCQITMPRKSRSAIRRRACCNPSSTSSLTVCSLVLNDDDGDAVAVVPQAHAVVFEHRLAGDRSARRAADRGSAGAVDRERGARHLRVPRGAEAALGAMHAVAAVEDPIGQRRVAHGLAGDDVLGDPVRDLLPAGGLPGFERAERPAVAPADREVDVARGVGDVGQVDRRSSGRDRGTRPTGTAPADASLCAQRGELLGRDPCSLSSAATSGSISPAPGGSPAPARSRTRMSLPRLRVDARAGLLAQRALGDRAPASHFGASK